MCTYWGQGSPYENASFFNFHDNNSALPAFDIFDFCNSFSMKELTDLDEALIYQDPGMPTRITIKTDAQIETWLLFGVDGTKVQEGIFHKEEPPYRLDFNNITPGLYLLRLSTTNGKVMSGKVTFY